MNRNSKTLRMSRSAEGRNARKDLAIRGRAGGSRAALLAPDTLLTGRRFRRANGLGRAEAALLETALRERYSPATGIKVSVDMDEFSRMMTGRYMS